MTLGVAHLRCSKGYTEPEHWQDGHYSCPGGAGVTVDIVDGSGHTGPMSAPTLAVKEPRSARRARVLFEDFQVTADTVRKNPGEWHLVGGGDEDRYGVFSQTAYRIRRGQISAFADPQGGFWEVQVSTDKRVERDYAVEVYLRFVPVKTG